MENIAREIFLRAKKDVFSGNLGNNISAFKGDGLDFSEIREYRDGDDVKKINWKATAKDNRLRVNLFHEERELNIVVAFMVSGSINFGSVKLKQDIIAEIMALISFSAIKNSDRLWTLFFSEKVEDELLPTKNEAIVYEIIERALNISPINKSINFKNFCEYINSTQRKKSLIFIIGDFYEEIDLSEISHKNEIYALIVRDRVEENLSLNGEFELVNPNNLNSNQFNLDKSVAKEYRRLLKAHDDKLKSHFLEHGITYGKIYTNDDVYLRLSQILKG